MIAEYKCVSCAFAWSTEVLGGPLPPKHDKQHSDKCPLCGSLYFKWTNA